MKCQAHIVLACFFIFLFSSHSIGQNSKENSISIHHSNGLIFTDIEINGSSVKAMIDFGDPHVLMLSHSLTKIMEIPSKKTGDKAYYINGNSFDLYEGQVSKLKVGKWEMANVQFASSPCEIEGLNENIDLTFDAVLGWGYFSQFYISVDYSSNVFHLEKELNYASNVEFSSNYTRKNGYLELEMDINGILKNFIIDSGSPISLIDRDFAKSLQSRFLSTRIGEQDLNLTLYSTDLQLLTQMGIYGMLGTDFFKDYTLTIDPFTETIQFSPSAYRLSLKSLTR